MVLTNDKKVFDRCKSVTNFIYEDKKISNIDKCQISIEYNKYNNDKDINNIEQKIFK